jgi:hypothetical protein
LALASTNRSPSSFAQREASSVGTSRCRSGCVEEASGDGDGETRSTLLPTSIQVRCGSACSRTSASHERTFMKPIRRGRSRH